MPKTDVIDVIQAQHQQVARLLTEVAVGTGDALDASFCELRRLIAVHETAEEEIVYPTIRLGDAEGEGNRVADARTAEEKEGIKTLAELEGMEPGSAEFTALFSTFRIAVVSHAEAEESTVFPLLRDSQTPAALRRMARTFELAEKVAPTHPHPHTGTSATSNLITGPALAIMDHVRDAIRKT
jgi:hemerythrin superfamily protein